MAWDPALDRLQTVLANLYARDSDVRRVVASAGLDAAFIDFDGPAIGVWHQALSEALRRNRVEAVIAVAQQEYPDNAELSAAVETVRASAPGVSVSGASNRPGATNPERAAGTRRVLSAPAWLAIGAGVLVVAIVAVMALRSPAAGPGPTATLAPGATTAAPPTATPTAPPPTPTPAPSATWTPAQPTPFPAVTFVSEVVFDQPEDLAPVEYQAEPGILPSETITDFLRLTRIAWGTLVEPQDEAFALSFTLALKNTSDLPITLDLDQRFFQLVDAQGRTGELVYFCCAARGEFLPPGRVREMQLIYRANPAWGGKSSGASEALLEVRGLLPVLRASWPVRLPVTGE